MPESSKPGPSRLTKTHKLSFAGVATLGAAALAFSLVPGTAGAETGAQSISAKPVAWTQTAGGTNAVQDSVAKQQDAANQQAKDAKAKADAEAKKKSEADKKAKAQADAKAQAQAKADKERADKEAASRSAKRATVKAAAPAAKSYANNLDGWIKQSLDIMSAKGIPGSYEGIHRNIMRESGGDPNAINNTDSNAVAGTPSQGLLQVIQPTFEAYHVDGTSSSLTDPVANITAACNYAAQTYGSIDNVDSAY